MRNFYRVGDKVKIKPSSSYYGGVGQIPKDSYGVVYKIRDSGPLPILVRWGDDFEWMSNTYKLSDLEPY